MAARGGAGALCRRAGGAGAGPQPVFRGRRRRSRRDRVRAAGRVVDARAAIAPGAPLVHEGAARTSWASVISPMAIPTAPSPRPTGASPSRCIIRAIPSPRSSASSSSPNIWPMAAMTRSPISRTVQPPPVMARALRVPGTRLRLKTPPIAAAASASSSRSFLYRADVPRREDIGPAGEMGRGRLEHLQAASTGPARHATAEAAVTSEGRILALRFDNIEDYGAYLRAPMPGPLYRMHGATAGAYDVANIAITNRLALTNTMPAGLIAALAGRSIIWPGAAGAAHRGRACLDPLDVIRRNLVRTFPHRTAAGALLRFGRLRARRRGGGGRRAARRAQGAPKRSARGGAALRHRLRRRSRAQHSNMGYLSTLLTPEARERAGPKNGAVSLATVTVDPLGAVSVSADVAVEGQGHATVLAQIVAEALASRWMTCASISSSTPRRMPGRSPPAPIPAASRPARRSPRTRPRRKSARASPRSRRSS